MVRELVSSWFQCQACMPKARDEAGVGSSFGEKHFRICGEGPCQPIIRLRFFFLILFSPHTLQPLRNVNN